MKRRLSAVDARKRFGEVLEGVYYRGDEVLIERAGKKMAVVIPLERYEAMERSRDRFMELVEQNWEQNKDVPPEDMEAAIERVIRKSRGQQAHARQGS